MDGSEMSALAEKIKAELRALAPDRKTLNTQLFLELYPVIEEMRSKNVTQKAILAVLKDHGLSLHPARFKALLDEAQKHSKLN